MKDAIVWKGWIWDPCWLGGQRASHAKVPFSLAQFPLCSIAWQLSPCTSATCQCSWCRVWCRQQSVTQQPAALHGAAFLRWQRKMGYTFYRRCLFKGLLNCITTSYCELCSRHWSCRTFRAGRFGYMLGEQGGEVGEGWLLREGVAWNEAVVGETTHPPHKTGAAGTGYTLACDDRPWRLVT